MPPGLAAAAAAGPVLRSQFINMNQLPQTNSNLTQHEKPQHQHQEDDDDYGDAFDYRPVQNIEEEIQINPLPIFETFDDEIHGKIIKDAILQDTNWKEIFWANKM